MKLNAKIDGENIIITKSSFEYILLCMCNQKYIHEFPTNDDLELTEEAYNNLQENNQKIIDECWKEAMDILHTPLNIFFEEGVSNYALQKRWGDLEPMEWGYGEVYNIIAPLFPDEHVERTIFNDNMAITISRGGDENRPWTEDERMLVETTLRNYYHRLNN